MPAAASEAIPEAAAKASSERTHPVEGMQLPQPQHRGVHAAAVQGTGWARLHNVILQFTRKLATILRQCRLM